MYKVGDRVIITNGGLQQADRVGYTYPVVDFSGRVSNIEYIANGHFTDVVFRIINSDNKVIGRFFEESLKIDVRFYRNQKLKYLFE